MEDNHIDTLIDMLSWIFKDIEKQQIAMNMLKKKITVRQFNRLIMPNDKDSWLNASKVIASIESSIYVEGYMSLLEWLRDFTIPGANNIYDRLRMVNFIEYEYEFYKTLDYANRIGDSVWVRNLEALKNGEKLSM